MPNRCRDFLLKRICDDKGGVVSLEYVVVAACVVGTVVLVFGAPTSPLGTAMISALGSVGTTVATAVSGA
jgi:pilus assembly protein Flp/PilA